MEGSKRLIAGAAVIFTSALFLQQCSRPAPEPAATTAPAPEFTPVASLHEMMRDVIDPIGGSLETYRTCARQIREHLGERIDTLGFPPPAQPGGSSRSG